MARCISVICQLAKTALHARRHWCFGSLKRSTHQFPNQKEKKVVFDRIKDKEGIVMEDMVFPSGWNGLSKQEFLDIAERSCGVKDVVIRNDLKDLIGFSKSLMRIIDRLEKHLEEYDRSEVAKF